MFRQLRTAVTLLAGDENYLIDPMTDWRENPDMLF